MATKQTARWDTFHLYDSDGAESTNLAERMREFRDCGCIAGYWFFDPTTVVEDEDGHPDMIWDEFHQEYRHPEDVGPTVEEIDWSGIDDAD